MDNVDGLNLADFEPAEADGPVPLPASAAPDARAVGVTSLGSIGALARFKLMLDPLFPELASRPIFTAPPRALVDIGTGYGVPACWLAETFPGVRIYGIEPSANRVRVATRALGENGTVGTSADPIPGIRELKGAPGGLYADAWAEGVRLLREAGLVDSWYSKDSDSRSEGRENR